MYKFKKNLKKEFLDGRYVREIAKKVGITESYLSMILNSKRNCSGLLANFLTKLSNQDEIEYYFERIVK